MKTNFLDSGNHVFHFSDCSQFLPVEAVLSSTGTLFSSQSFLSTGNSIFFIFKFFSNVKYYWNFGAVKFQKRTIFLAIVY